jgi:transcriptional regulator with GAF, ATPase, and Fis domain
LENVLERAIILSSGTSLMLDAVQLGPVMLTKFREHGDRREPAPDADTNNTLQACERQHILRVCESTEWKIKGSDGAASILGLNPSTLYSRMRKLGIRRP